MGEVRLVAGLGNPGREYEGTRHNIGFAVVDRLAAQWECSFREKRRLAAVIAEHGRLWLVKPQTFMNRSGVAVQAVLQWLKLSPAELLVVVDDADLPLGRMKVLASGGSGGHNGLRSIIESLGGEEGFGRVRVGIGRSGPAGADLTDHVLGRFAPAERDVVEAAVARAAAAVECCVTRGLAAAMNQFNRKVAEGETH
jgi:PTH1 family peptidyl-tRNA hydrolase